MTTSQVGSPRSLNDPLRAEIEVALRDELKRRRANVLRWALVGVCVAVALASVALNVLIVGDPARVGLASQDSVERVQGQVDALIARQRADAARVSTRLGAVERSTAAALPVVCAAIDRVGTWAFTGEVRPKGCAAALSGRP
jgi:hypothetical protein